MDIQEIVLSEPLLFGAVTLAVILLGHYQKGLSYREYRFLHLGKCFLFNAINSYAEARGRPLIQTKDNLDYLTTVDDNVRTVAKDLWKELDPHLIATAKRRETIDGYQWTHSQFVLQHDDGTQTEIYLFASEGKTDVYAHLEGSFTDVEEHLTGDQKHGDPKGVFADSYSG